MSKERLTLTRLAQEQAKAEVLKPIVPQMFSGPEILTDGAPDSGGTDYWMMSNIPGDVLLPAIALETIGIEDNRPEILRAVQLVLRGVKGVGGFNMKIGENIATSALGGAQRKVMKRPGWSSRNITNRGWERKAESEGVDVEE